MLQYEKGRFISEKIGNTASFEHTICYLDLRGGGMYILNF